MAPTDKNPSDESGPPDSPFLRKGYNVPIKTALNEHIKEILTWLGGGYPDHPHAATICLALIHQY